ncbi:hypothetical protein DVH05_022026 [Phytophthora capsici]|nr:hypothetical protein DVH05_022026 [Phytophthora capsici]
MLSTKMLPFQKADNGIKTATSQMDPVASEKKAEMSSWGHFTAFNSMEDYVDTTLIQYNKEDEDNDKEP